jgi:DNA-binding SARP family transcriptional activator
MWLEQDIPPSCGLRVFLYGPLEVCKRTADGTWKPVEKKVWGKGRVARSAFKRLLVAPGRRLSRVALQDDLWPDTENFELADKNVYNAINRIRQVIGKTLVTTRETSYEIVDQSQIWIDCDACEALLKEAENQEPTSPQTLPLLERALTLLERGELLEGEDGQWCYAFRKRAEDMLRQVRLWLAASYETQGKLWQAGEQYRAMILKEPSDEEALQHWLEMLARHGKWQEALKCSQEIKEFVETHGFSFSNELEQVIASLNEKSTLVLFSPLQTLGRRLLYLPSQYTDDTSHFLDDLLQNGGQHAFSPAIRGCSIPSSFFGQHHTHDAEPISQTTWFAFQETQLLTDILQGQDASDEALQRRLNRDFLRFALTTPVSNEERSNQLLLNAAILPLTHLELLQSHRSQSHIEDVLRQCAASLVACQHLLRRGNFFHVEYVLTHILPMLTELSSHASSPYQKRAASLASQGYRLANILALHHDNLSLKEHYCKQALQQSLIAEDHSLSVAALKGLAVTFYYRGIPFEAREVYRQALQYNNNCSTLLYSCVSIGLAQAYAQCGEEKSALDAIEQAHSAFPKHPESDRSFLYADFDRTQLVLWEGLTYLALGHYHFAQNERHLSQSYCQKAWETFATIEQTSKQIPPTARDRTDILNHMASTALVLDNPQQFCSYLEQGMKEIVVLGSKKRKKELIATYLQGRNVWPHDTALKEVGDALLVTFFTEDHPLS